MPRPLIICDVDEVVLAFASGLDRYLEPHGLVLDRSSYALSGNIRHGDGSGPATAERTRDLLSAFKRDGVHALSPVPGAANVLADLATLAEIRFLTNIATETAGRRARHLAKLGMPYPVAANAGPKGRAAARLANGHRRRHPDATVFFIDDSHANHRSVAAEADGVVHVHFVADPGFRAVAPKVEGAVLVTGDWREVGGLIRGMCTAAAREGDSA